MSSRIEDLDTPALLLDGPASQRNLCNMADYFRGKSCQLRPHFKNHKCTTLARRQLEAGCAVGMTCAKLGEAQVLAEHGVDDILIANQVVGALKVERLVHLAKHINIAVAVDDVDQSREIAAAAQAAGVTVGVLIEVDVGMKRCGVLPGEPTLALARQLIDLPGIEFRGFQAFEGHLVYVDDFDERDRLTRESVQHAIDTRDLLAQHGIDIKTISGGSSATYRITGLVDGFTELQCGTYATMDWRYHQVVPEFEIALSVLVSVISRPQSDMAVIDLGIKGAGCEFGVPLIKDHPNVEIPYFLSEEHTVINRAPNWRVGQKLQLIPSHACTTCNLHRQIHVHEEGQVVDVWPIEGSGKLA